MSKFRLVLAERLDADKAVRCGYCHLSPEDPAIPQRYRFVLEDENGERSEYCFPCAKGMLEEVAPALYPRPEPRRRTVEFFKPSRIRTLLHG